LRTGEHTGRRCAVDCTYIEEFVPVLIDVVVGDLVVVLARLQERVLMLPIARTIAIELLRQSLHSQTQ
jgi:hypothetical protein